mgnify:CR=1 FL=1
MTKRALENTTLYQFVYHLMDDYSENKQYSVKISPLFNSKIDMLDHLADQEILKSYPVKESVFNDVMDKFEDIFLVHTEFDFRGVATDEGEIVDVTWSDIKPQCLRFNVNKYKYNMDAWIAYEKATSYGEHVDRHWRLIFREYFLEPNHSHSKLPMIEHGERIYHSIEF